MILDSKNSIIFFSLIFIDLTCKIRGKSYINLIAYLWNWHQIFHFNFPIPKMFKKLAYFLENDVVIDFIRSICSLFFFVPIFQFQKRIKISLVSWKWCDRFFTIDPPAFLLLNTSFPVEELKWK